MPQITGNTVKAIAILSKNRSPSLPDLASAHEQGLTDFDIPSWYALFLPKGTPGADRPEAQRCCHRGIGIPSVKNRLQVIGSDLVGPERTSPEYLASSSPTRSRNGPVRSWRSGVQF